MERDSGEENGSRTQVGSREFSFTKENSFIQPSNRHGFSPFSAARLQARTLGIRRGQGTASPL